MSPRTYAWSFYFTIIFDLWRTQCRRLPALRGVRGRVVLSTKPFPHKCAKARARTWDLPVIDGRL